MSPKASYLGLIQLEIQFFFHLKTQVEDRRKWFSALSTQTHGDPLNVMCWVPLGVDQITSALHWVGYFSSLWAVDFNPPQFFFPW